jgi:hypothetical protein
VAIHLRGDDRPVDITEEILFQHHEQRRMFALLDEMHAASPDALAAVWKRLAVLLEVHAEAEEKFFYPELLKLASRAAGKEHVADETKDAIKDHNEIRDAVSRVAKHEPGSDAWWDAVRDAREANGDHMAEEERDDLADFRRYADLDHRHRIAEQFVVFEARHAQGISSEDHDPGSYVREHS